MIAYGFVLSEDAAVRGESIGGRIVVIVQLPQLGAFSTPLRICLSSLFVQGVFFLGMGIPVTSVLLWPFQNRSVSNFRPPLTKFSSLAGQDVIQ